MAFDARAGVLSQWTACIFLILWVFSSPVFATSTSVLALHQAVLTSPAQERVVSLPHALSATDFEPDGGLVHYRLSWHIPTKPDSPQAVYVSKMGLSGRLSVNGQRIGECGYAPLPELRCLHQPQLFGIPAALLHMGENTLDFEIYATARQMNGLSVVQVGDANALHEQFYMGHRFLTVDLQVGLIWLSALLGLISLTVALILRHETVFLWFGLTSLLNAVAALNGVVVHPMIDIDVYNWLIFWTRLVSVPLSFLTVLAIFDKDHRRITQVLLYYSLLVPVAIWLSDNNRNLAFALYIPLVLACPVLLYLTLRWTQKSRNPIQAISALMMLILFVGGVLDWLRLGGRAQFDGMYVTTYTYSGMLVTIGLLLLTRLATALVQSQKMGAMLERQVAERIAYEVTENIPVGTFTLTTPADRVKPHFAFMSRRFLQITGLQPQATVLKVREFFAIVHPEDRPALVRLYAQAFRHQAPFSGRMRIRVDEQTRWVNIESSPRECADGSTVWEGVLIDETEQVLAREAAERDRAALQVHLLAQSRVQEREQLLRDVHDGFGSQLASVRVMVEKGRIPSAELPGYLQEISADLHLVINSLGQSDITFEEALADMRYRIEHRFLGSGLAFDWSVSLEGMPPLPSRTILQILRIMQEAVHNAIRHADPHRIALSAVYDLHQARLHIAIQDDGVGMPEHPRQGRGLGNMRHRAREIGAQWGIRPGHPGTVVELQLDHPGSQGPSNQP